VIATVEAGPVPIELLALTVAVKLPDAVGVPLISPVEVLIVSPDGRPVALKETGVLVAVSCSEAACPTVALSVEALVIAETSPIEIVRSTTGPDPNGAKLRG